MNVLAIDIGGTNIKILATGEKEPRKFPSGPILSPQQMMDGVKKLAPDWNYDVVSIGYPGVVVDNRILTEPHNLAKGWVGFNFHDYLPQTPHQTPGLESLGGALQKSKALHLRKLFSADPKRGERVMEGFMRASPSSQQVNWNNPL